MSTTKAEVLAKIKRVGLIPILRTTTADEALSMGEVLVKAGITTLEIPLTVPGALEVIRKLADKYGDAVVLGAGTVLNVKSAEACRTAGATFVLSPAVDMDTIAYCNKVGLAVFPGALTPTEILGAWNAGADVVKVFPCSAMGGASYLKAVKAPLPQIELAPTGGVSIDTAAAFIKAGAVALGVGSNLVDLEALHAGRGHLIAERATKYLQIVKDSRA